MNPIIAPSILASDFANLESEIKMLNESVADWIHLDIMDGHYVPNISFGIPVVASVKKHAKKPLDVHLMIEKPERYLADFKKAGADILTVHYEACTHLHRVVQQIKELDCKAGVALNPHTPVELLEDIIQDLDMVLIMSVNPGFGGQKFIGTSYSRIRTLKDLMISKNSNALIEVDGGVNSENARSLLEAGVDVLVAGSFVFKSGDPLKTIEQLKGVYA